MMQILIHRKFASPAVLVLLFLNFGSVFTIPKDESTAAVVRFTNSLVPPLFQVFSSNRTNLVMAPFGLAMSIAITMDCVQGEAFDEITKLFKLQSKSSRQLLRAGFRSILQDFRQNSVNDEVAGSFNKAFLSSSKKFPPSFVDQLAKNYLVDITTNTSMKHNSNYSDRVMELRTDTGIMSHWRDFEKLAVYTYLSYSPSSPFYISMNRTTSVPMIPLIGYFKAGYLTKLHCHGAELLFENRKASLLVLMPENIDELTNLQTKLFKENFFDVLDSLSEQETKIMFPQLSTVTNNLELKPFLKMLGIVSIFNQQPSQSHRPHQKSNTTKGSNINATITASVSTNANVFVQSVKQNAFFSTSYTSLNSVGTFGTKYDNNRIDNRQKREALLKITFDKPFTFFVIHRESGLILLSGQICDPKVLPS